MATHVLTATTTSPTPSAHQISIYGHPSPVNSTTTTPTNNSPTSPRQQYLPLATRQLRPPKGPLYVPAALRPTERPQKASPPTPPRSIHGSLDSLNEEQDPLSRRSTIESAEAASQRAEHEWMRYDFGEVTGNPTRDHWKADSASPTCDSPSCRSSFGLFLRRHHCRHCGHVFCSSHTPHAVPLDQEARFHPNGVLSRACDLCWHAYQRWEEGRTERFQKMQNLVNESPIQQDQPSPAEDPNGLKGGPAPATEIAASVPRGWNWSTF